MTFALRVFFIFLLPGVFTHGLSQSNPPGHGIPMTDALVISAAPGCLENLGVRDPMEGSIVHGTWKPPVAGDVVQYHDTSRGVWEVVRANDKGWFEHPALRSGYVYCRVTMPSDTVMILKAMAHTMVYINGTPRAGNPYGQKDEYEAWEPRFDYSLIPVQLHKGGNDLLFYCSRGRLKAGLDTLRAMTAFNPRDVTMPDLLAGQSFDTYGSIVLVHSAGQSARNFLIRTTCPDGTTLDDRVPVLPPLSVCKIPVRLQGNAPLVAGAFPVRLALIDRSGKIPGEADTCTVMLRVVSRTMSRKETFISTVDGSVQYYAVTPSSDTLVTRPPALFLSLHGAGVEAINQASSYAPKAWGVIVAPTNRRPYGFNWEDWGRTDAMEVLDLAKKKFSVDESRIYLTGHSMGGHGTYHVGGTFPDQFAALGPSAGWISFWSYRVREQFNDPSPMRAMLMRPATPSDTYTLSRNFEHLGVYILHGREDDNVPVSESRSMAQHLATFDKDFVYHEQPGVGHWWDLSEEPGADCVDWPPMFDFFARHARPGADRLRHITFTTASPGISSRSGWGGLEAQEHQLAWSSVDIQVDPHRRYYAGITSNVARLSIDLSHIAPSVPVRVQLDGQKVLTVNWPVSGSRAWLERRSGVWELAGEPAPDLKRPIRYGTFKDVIRNRVVFVYGTQGSDAEQRWAFDKTRFDAERFWYQGNGSIEVMPDTLFLPEAEPDRNVVLYGNARTNSAWMPLLGKSPVQVEPGLVRVGNQRFNGEDLSCLFLRPRPGSALACVGAVAGTGLIGMRTTNRMPYLMPGIGFPDLLVERSSVFFEGEGGIVIAGFFGLDWIVDRGEFVTGEETHSR